MKLPTRFTSAYTRLLAHRRPTIMAVAVLSGCGMLVLAGALTLSIRWHNADRLVTVIAPTTAQTQSQPNYTQSNLYDPKVAAANHGQIPTPFSIFSTEHHTRDEELKGIPAT